MRKSFYFFIVAGIFLGFGFTNAGIDASPKVLDVFNRTFKSPRDVKWYTNENESIAVFTENEIRTIVTYDKDANFLISRRYYGESNLPLNILLKIREKYKGKKLGIVTEVIEDDSILYSVNVEDEQNVYVIESNGSTDLRLKLKFKKQ